MKMNIGLAIGAFFVVLGIIFGFAARSDYLTASHQWSPAAITRRRIAIIFGLVGIGLLIWHLYAARS